MSNLSKPVAAITGASSGIGAVYADRLAKRGYDLVLIARRGDRLEAIAKNLTAEHGTQVEVLIADLTSEVDIARVGASLAANERLSLLVNNAGYAKLSPFSKVAPVDTATMVALNVTALTRLTEAVLPGFLNRNAGAFINIASVLALHSLAISSVYSGTKGYVLNFSRGLQAELADTGVKVQLVLPATTATELWDIAGIPLEQLNQSSVMTAENMVDAALAGFDNGEQITLPSVHDASLWDAYDAARGATFGATQTGIPAPRYKIS